MSLPTRTRLSEDAAGQGVLAILIARTVHVAHRIHETVRTAGSALPKVVTPVGWGVLVAATLALAAGYVWGWAELVALGWGLAIAVGLAALWLIGTGASKVELTLPTPRVAVGELAEARLTAENPGHRRFGGVQLELPVGDRVLERVLPALPRGGVVDERLRIPTQRRGVVPIGPARTVRADPIGIVRREVVWSGTVLLHVHPRTVAMGALSTGFVRDLEGSPTRDLTASDIAFHALREYVPGDDRRHIHWRSSAKTGTFMVRQFEETRRSRLIVLLDLDPSAYADDEEFELAVSAAASLGARAIRDARSLAFVASGAAGARSPVRQLPTVSRDRLLDALSLVQLESRAAALPDVARAAGETQQGVSLAFLVTGTAHGVAHLRLAASRLPLGIETIGVRCVPEGEASSRQSSGLTVLGIGYLEDLQAMLARRAANA
ncbi:DUF58 domain-containing protein [Agromyces aerolatus]|uniref:DUF58 domain-containing protein n=1 Tax=Agromyces sp. LY-1074 TaxID=3074080 RepID=UPI00285B9F74|nr:MULTISPECIES: DUF58 domain-containing protein [unclassified Agromyces]MDR5701308.1 DUF58 domain-containing protein [Agromyces sp. LY-1074]MDR5707566.1 DUF58 domain-containing protein [Agromyces sp. LY-1358]